MSNDLPNKIVLGRNPCIGEYVLLGYCKMRKDLASEQTIIGDDAVIRSHTVIYSGNQIGNNFQTGHHVMVREFNIIGDNVSIGTGSIVEHHIRIANSVRVHSGVFIPEYSVLEEGCWIGPNVTLTNARYPKSKNVKDDLKGPEIGRGAKVGANVTILPGVIIGQNSLIGAGSVVVKDVPPGKVYAGNPAREINEIENLAGYEGMG